MSIVLGEYVKKRPRHIRFMNRFELFRLLQISRFTPANPEQHFDSQFKEALRLFVLLVEHIRNACEQRGVRLGLILMSGRSFVERPGSLSALFQDYLRREIIERKEDMKVKVIDLASVLRERFRTDGSSLYHPHEGHLTSAGHRIMADILFNYL